ncbi:hypothetical protein MNV49_001459 [Pseudohyphozyma bogoriensis]|nr:hypothetical protein MNV49_001459 [Pseudohyphozyma bogoriensis]
MIRSSSRLLTRLRPTPAPSAARLAAPLARPLSSSSRRLERAPTFTTDEPAPKPHDSSVPLPAANIPVDAYASPLLTTQSVLYRTFRYSVFGSVAIVLLFAGTFAGFHVYVEQQLPRAAAGENEDEQGWSEELEGWTGGYLGGGTDPRVGLKGRMAIRAAWFAQNWGVRTRIDVPDDHGGGAFIGKAATKEHEIKDPKWEAAETYLCIAALQMDKKGISVTVPRQDGGIDRAALELEQRLAGVREKLGGRYKLVAAREGWERVYYALSAVAEPGAWEKRERLRATKKLGEISARLAGTWVEGSVEHKEEMEKAKGWLYGGLIPVLGEFTESTSTLAESKKSVGPKTSFFGFWSHSHPSADTSSSTSPHSTLISLLSSSLSSTPPPPATSRAILNSLLSLETFLARSHQLPEAKSLQSSALVYANALHPSLSSTPSVLSTGQGRSSTVEGVNSDRLQSQWRQKKWAASALSEIFLLTRTSLFATHLAEVTIALNPKSTPTSLTLLQGAINDSEHALDAASTAPAKLSDHALERAFKAIQRDSKLTGGMAAKLVAFVHESCGKQKGRKESWCGGDVTAELFWAKALTFDADDESAAAGAARTRKRVVAASAAGARA